MKIFSPKGYIVSLVVAIIFLFLFITTFSSVESRYECKGELTFKGKSQVKIIYIKLEEYRWWVGLWGDSDGMLHLEFPNEWVENFNHIKENGDQLQIYDRDKKLIGNLSTLSKKLALNTSIGFFDGTCSKIEKK